MNAAVRAPSPKSRLNKFGIRNPIKNASAATLSPSAAARMASRNKPANREISVRMLTSTAWPTNPGESASLVISLGDWAEVAPVFLRQGQIAQQIIAARTPKECPSTSIACTPRPVKCCMTSTAGPDKIRTNKAKATPTLGRRVALGKTMNTTTEIKNDPMPCTM